MYENRSNLDKRNSFIKNGLQHRTVSPFNTISQNNKSENELNISGISKISPVSMKSNFDLNKLKETLNKNTGLLNLQNFGITDTDISYFAQHEQLL